MALTKCIDCGKEMSDNAVSCPNCGAPIKDVTPQGTSDIAGGQTKYCAGCGKQMHISATTCPHCGFVSTPKVNSTAAIVGIIINIIFWPGLGTIIGGDVGIGVIQMVLYVFGWLCIFTLIGAIIGIPLVIAMWIWALVSSINQLRKT
jgi:DNA-directed RNA polymerase subunit RPC12/RpoP/TM2 domain-containing membrane protein YozV